MTTVGHIAKSGTRATWPISSARDAAVVPVAQPGYLTRIVATWHAAINFLVPIGYEDETGFHYGEMPGPSESL